MQCFFFLWKTLGDVTNNASLDVSETWGESSAKLSLGKSWSISTNCQTNSERQVPDLFPITVPVAMTQLWIRQVTGLFCGKHMKTWNLRKENLRNSGLKGRAFFWGVARYQKYQYVMHVRIGVTTNEENTLLAIRPERDPVMSFRCWCHGTFEWSVWISLFGSVLHVLTPEVVDTLMQLTHFLPAAHILIVPGFQHLETLTTEIRSLWSCSNSAYLFMFYLIWFY